MTGLGESAGITAKVLQVLKDLPLWLLAGLAAAAGVLLWIPSSAASVSAAGRPWFIVAAIVFGVLSAARAIGILFERITYLEGLG